MNPFVFDIKSRDALLSETVCIDIERERAAREDVRAWLNPGVRVGNLREATDVRRGGTIIMASGHN